MAGKIKFDHEQDNFLDAVGATSADVRAAIEKFMVIWHESSSFSETIERVIGGEDVSLDTVFMLMIVGWIFFNQHKTGRSEVLGFIKLLMDLVGGYGGEKN